MLALWDCFAVSLRFLNRTGRICSRINQRVTRLASSLPQIEVGDILEVRPGTAATNATRNSWNTSLGGDVLFSGTKTPQKQAIWSQPRQQGHPKKTLTAECRVNISAVGFTSSAVPQVVNNLDMYTLTFTVWAKAGSEFRATISYSEAAGWCRMV